MATTPACTLGRKEQFEYFSGINMHLLRPIIKVIEQYLYQAVYPLTYYSAAHFKIGYQQPTSQQADKRRHNGTVGYHTYVTSRQYQT